MTEINLSCRCGKVSGILHRASPSTGNRFICYCESCRRFPNHLGAEGVLDEYGGTDIYQAPIGHVEFTAGRDLLKCLKVTEKGAFRWYAGCCQTPIGNTGPSALPMMGVIHACMQIDDRDTVLGPIRLDGNTQDALKPLPVDRQRGAKLPFALRFWSQMLFWKLTAKSRPNPVFDASGSPIVKPEFLG
jgi:hypothetical protein